MRIIGRTSKDGGTPLTADADTLYLVDTEAPAGARLLKVSAYLDGGGPASGSGSVRAAVFAGGNLIGQSEPVSIANDAPAAWIDFPLDEVVEAEGAVRLALHFGDVDEVGRIFTLDGDGAKVTDEYDNGPPATVGAGTAADDFAIFATYTTAAAIPDENDLYLAALGRDSAQRALAAGTSSQSSALASATWHGTLTDPETGSFALVRRDGPLADLVGERVRIKTFTEERGVMAYVHGEADLEDDEDLSLTRSLFAALAPLATELLTVTVEVMAEETRELES